jgi:hypothetical protein
MSVTSETSLADYLNQGEVWYSKTGSLTIAEMDEVYRRRCCDWLLRNAEGLLQGYILEEFDGKTADPTLDDKLGWADIRPYSWIKRTKLFLSVSQGIPSELFRKGGR